MGVKFKFGTVARLGPRSQRSPQNSLHYTFIIKSPLRHRISLPLIINVATKGGVGSKNDRRAGTHFFELGGYKIEPLLTKMVNDDI